MFRKNLTSYFPVACSGDLHTLLYYHKSVADSAMKSDDAYRLHTACLTQRMPASCLAQVGEVSYGNSGLEFSENCLASLHRP